MIESENEKKPEGFKDLTEIRDMLKDLMGDVMRVHVGTTVGYLASLGGKTAEDVEKSKEQMLMVLQKYVQAEILLDKVVHGYEPELADLDCLRFDN